jgi:hypothetical protein
MHGLGRESLEDEEVEGTVEEVGCIAGHGGSLHEVRGEGGEEGWGCQEG